MRTTCSVEAYNRVLNDNIVNNGNLFTFVHDIRNEEQLKRDEMEELLESGSATAKKRRAAYVVCNTFVSLFLNMFCT